MEHRPLGMSGLKVSPICLGAMMFGDRTDESTSKKIIDMGLDHGVNFIDTADVYNGGLSEEITGRAIAEKRQNWILATKLAGPMSADPNHRGLSPALGAAGLRGQFAPARHRLCRYLLLA